MRFKKYFWLVLFAIITLINTWGVVGQSANLTGALMHYWSLNETTTPYYDFGSRGFDISGVDSTAGVFSNAWGYGTVRTGSGTSYFLGPNFTISMWLQSTGNVDRLYTLQDDSTHGIAIQYGDDEYKLSYVDGAASTTTNPPGSSNTGQWYHYVWVINGSHIIQYQDGDTEVVTALGAQDGVDIDTTKLGEDLTSQGCQGECKIDEIGIWNRTLTDYDLYVVVNETPIYANFSDYAIPDFSVYARSNQSGTPILSYNVTINNASLWDTDTGVIITNYTQNTGELVDIIINSSGYTTREYQDWNTSYDLYANLTSLFELYGFRYSNYTEYSGNNYTRVLNYSLNIVCQEGTAADLSLWINGSLTNYINDSLSCAQPTQYIQGQYRNPTEGFYTIGLGLNTSGGDYAQVGNGTFFSDLYAPTNVFFNYSYVDGFHDPLINLTFQCNDTASPYLTYNVSLGGTSQSIQNVSPLYWDNVSVTLIDTANQATGYCADFFSVNTTTLTNPIYGRTLVLIDEQTNSVFDVTNLSTAVVYFDDNSTSHDFKSAGNAYVNFTSGSTDKLRFELGYEDASIITRYVDISLTSPVVRVCANKHNIEHYEQFILSANERPVQLLSVYSDCTVGTDYTRFAYQDANILKAFTTARNYYLKLYENGIANILASVDGSLSSYVNIDVIEFSQRPYELTILRGAISYREEENRVNIYYQNLANDSVIAETTITRLDNSQVVFTDTETSSPNQFNIYFDYSTLTPAINETTLFKIQVIGTDSGGNQKTVKEYFNIGGSGGVLNPNVAMVLGILLMIAGLSFTISRTALSWFGAFMALASIAVLSNSADVWYVILLQAIDAVILIYVVLVMFQQNQSTLA